jgi:hypothetical protein
MQHSDCKYNSARINPQLHFVREGQRQEWNIFLNDYLIEMDGAGGVLLTIYKRGISSSGVVG